MRNQTKLLAYNTFNHHLTNLHVPIHKILKDGLAFQDSRLYDRDLNLFPRWCRRPYILSSSLIAVRIVLCGSFTRWRGGRIVKR